MTLVDHRDAPPSVPRWLTGAFVVGLVLTVALGLGALSEGQWAFVGLWIFFAGAGTAAYVGTRRRVAAERAGGPDLSR